MAAEAEPRALLPNRVRPPGAAATAEALSDDWPHTTRLLPWMLAGFISVIWLLPFDAIDLPGNLPVDSKLDRVLLIPIVLFWLLCLTTSAGPRLRRTPLTLAFIVLLGIAIFSVLLNGETLSRLDELDLATKKLALLVSFLAFAYVLATTIRPSELWAFSRLIVILGSIAAVGVIYEYRTGTNIFYDWTRDLLGGFASVAPEPGDPTFGRENNTGPTAHALAIATMLAMALPFAFGGLFRSREKRDRILYGLAITLLLAASASTIRKTGAVAPAVALLVVFFYQPARMVRLLPFGVVVVILMQGLAPGAAVKVKAQFVNGTLTTSASSEGRTEDYEATEPDIDKYTALGRGYGSYDPYKYRFLDNQYLVQTIETGYFGLAAYLLVVLTAAAVGHRPARSGHPLRGPPAMAAVAGILVFGATSALFDALAFPHVPYMFGVMAAFAIVASSPAPFESQRARARAASSGGRDHLAAVAEPEDPVPTLPAGAPDVTVVIVTHNSRERALDTLRSVRGAVGNLAVQWFVVDSGSSDGTPDALAREWSDLCILERPNIGFAAANNLALPYALGRYVLLLNPDIKIQSGTLPDLTAALDARPDVGAASVIQVDAEGNLLPSIRRFPSPARTFGDALGVGRYAGLTEEVRPGKSYFKERDADWMVGAFLVLRRETLTEVGFLDERFFLYSEETDLCRRVRNAGWRIRHLPTMTITHYLGGYARPDLQAQLSWSKWLFARKHYGRMKSGAIGAGLAAGHMARIAALSPLALLSHSFRDRIRGETLALAVLLGRHPPPFRLASGNPV